MIRIRYEDARAGAGAPGWLYGRTERCHRGAVVYLRPGLTAGQRRAALRRLRQEAARGFGPPLPLPQLLLALALDRVAAAGGTATALVRLHPVAALVPGTLAAALAALVVLASAGGPAGPGQRPRGGPEAAALAVGVGPQLRPMVVVTARGARRQRSRQRSLERQAPRPVRPAAWYVTPQAARLPERPRRAYRPAVGGQDRR